jgi:preprotein translocase subunit SecE
VSSEVSAAKSAGPAHWIGATVEFLRAVRGELGKVTWPARDELIKATRMIVVLSLALGLAIGWLDWLLNLVLVNGVAALVR